MVYSIIYLELYYLLSGAVLCWVSIGKEVLRILDMEPGEDLQCPNPVISGLASG